MLEVRTGTDFANRFEKRYPRGRAPEEGEAEGPEQRRRARLEGSGHLSLTGQAVRDAWFGRRLLTNSASFGAFRKSLQRE
jgi:hypothetical protein